MGGGGFIFVVLLDILAVNEESEAMNDNKEKNAGSLQFLRLRLPGLRLSGSGVTICVVFSVLCGSVLIGLAMMLSNAAGVAEILRAWSG